MYKEIFSKNSSTLKQLRVFTLTLFFSHCTLGLFNSKPFSKQISTGNSTNT